MLKTNLLILLFSFLPFLSITLALYPAILVEVVLLYSLHLPYSCILSVNSLPLYSPVCWGCRGFECQINKILLYLYIYVYIMKLLICFQLIHPQVKSLGLMKTLEETETGFERDEVSGVIRCIVCDVTVNSPQLLATHIAGNKHKQKAAKRSGDSGSYPPTKRPCPGKWLVSPYKWLLFSFFLILALMRCVKSWECELCTGASSNSCTCYWCSIPLMERWRCVFQLVTPGRSLQFIEWPCISCLHLYFFPKDLAFVNSIVFTQKLDIQIIIMKFIVTLMSYIASKQLLDKACVCSWKRHLM